MKRLVLLLGIVILALGVWVMMPSGNHAVPFAPGTDTGSEGAPTGTALAAPVLETEEDATIADAAMQRAVVEAAEATAGQQRLVRVRVTNKLTGEPVPGATVSFYESFSTSDLEPAELEVYQSLSSDREKLTAHYGKGLLSDDLGLVVIPVKTYVRTTGRQGDLYGELIIRPDPESDADEQYELQLERDLTLRVRVVDAKGEPAQDVGVGLLPLWEDGARNQTLYTLGTSGKNGNVTVSHLQIRLARWKREEPYPSGHLLRPRIPGLTEGGIELDAENPPDEPVLLQLPPTGKVVLQATDKAGGPLPRQVVTSVFLAVPPEDPTQPDAAYRAPSDQRWSAQPQDDGQTVFERVVAGKSFLAAARVGNESLQELFDGPVAESQEVRVVLSPAADVYFLSGRLLGEDREPLASTRFRLRYGVSSGTSGSRSFSTEEDGRFTTYISVYRPTEDLTLNELAVEDNPLTATATEAALMYLMVGERPLVTGENDLGDLALSTGPLVAAGRITVNGEAPAQRVNLQVQWLQVRQTSRSTYENWNSEQLTARYPEPGRFEFRGRLNPGRHRISVSGNTFLPADPVEFAIGQEDVRIELDTGGSLGASVLVDGGVPTNHLWLRLIPTQAQPTTEEGAYEYDPSQSRLYAKRSGETGEAHRFRWPSLWPGGYRLEVLTRGSTAPLVEIGGIHVAGGDESRDPRLDEIDLRGKLRVIVMKVIDSEGAPIGFGNNGPPIAFLQDRTPDAMLHGFSAPPPQGDIQILTAAAYLDLLVVCPGYKPKEIAGVNQDTTVVLDNFPEVTLKLAGGLPKLPEGTSLRPSISRSDRERDQRRISSDYMSGSLEYVMQPVQQGGAVNAAGEAMVFVGEDGTYRVSISLHNDSLRRSSGLRGIEPAEVEVRAALSPQVFTIRIPEESLKQAIEQISGG